MTKRKPSYEDLAALKYEFSRHFDEAVEIYEALDSLKIQGRKVWRGVRRYNEITDNRHGLVTGKSLSYPDSGYWSFGGYWETECVRAFGYNEANNDDVAESNFRVAERRLKEEFADLENLAWIHSEIRGMGVSHVLLVNLEVGVLADFVNEMLDKLEDYPVLDDEDLSDLELEHSYCAICNEYGIGDTDDHEYHKPVDLADIVVPRTSDNDWNYSFDDLMEE